MSPILPSQFEPSFDTFVEHLQYLDRTYGTFNVEMTFDQVATLISQGQLALRHPRNTGSTAQMLRQILDAWIAKLDEVSPGIGDQFKAGFDSRFDCQTGT